jgi:hypothetical protein
MSSGAKESVQSQRGDSPADASPASTGRGRKVVFALVLLLLFAGLAEAGLRVAYFVTRGSWNFMGDMDKGDKLYKPHPYTAYQLVPDSHVESRNAVIHISRWGTRGPDQAYEKPPGHVRIVCLGGSTTFSILVSDDAHTWPLQLERMLNEHYATDRVEVLNYAAPGYNSAEALHTFMLRAIDRDPDIVIFHEGWNEIAAATDPGFQADYSHRRKANAQTQKPLWYRLAVVRLYRYMSDVMRKRTESPGTLEELPPRALEIYERNMESLVFLAKPRGIAPVFITMATRLPPDDDPDALSRVDAVPHKIFQGRLTPAGLFRAMKANNDRMRSVALRHGCLLVDLANTYPREAENFVPGDFGHKTDRGDKLFARMAADAIIADGVVERALRRNAEAAAATGAAN